MLLIVPAALVMGMVFRRESVSDGARRKPGPTESGSLPTGFWSVWISPLLCSSFEFCFTTWSSDVLRQHAHAVRSLAALGVSAVVIGLVVGGLLAARLSNRY